MKSALIRLAGDGGGVRFGNQICHVLNACLIAFFTHHYALQGDPSNQRKVKHQSGPPLEWIESMLFCGEKEENLLVLKGFEGQLKKKRQCESILL